MPVLDVVLAIILLTVATFLTRAGVLLVGDRWSPSARIESALRFAPACALSALIAPEVLSSAGVVDLTLGNPRWPAALVAAVFLAWRQSMLGGIALGMATYAAIRLLA